MILWKSLNVPARQAFLSIFPTHASSGFVLVFCGSAWERRRLRAVRERGGKLSTAIQQGRGEKFSTELDSFTENVGKSVFSNGYGRHFFQKEFFPCCRDFRDHER
ncbi:MAG: hypothetical protein ACI3XP_01685 [Eubacteriales bacterium]